MIFAPAQFANRAEFYHQLAQLTAAGIDILRSLDQLRRNPPARSYRAPIEQVIHSINAGGTLGESLRSCGKWLPDFDLALVEAGERSGKLDSTFLLLAGYYSDRARIARQLISELVYPVALLHFAIFVFPFAQFFLTGNTAAYLRQTLGILVPLYLVCGLFIFLGQSRHGERWRAFVELVLHAVPVLGVARRQLAIARLSAALNALVNAGVSIFEAWELGAAASGSPAIRRAVDEWLPRLRAGKTPTEMVQSSPVFPHLFANEYGSGEISGKLDECLGRMRHYYQEEGARKMHAFAQWVPRGLYFLIVIFIAIRIVNFYAGYFGQIQQIME